MCFVVNVGPPGGNASPRRNAFEKKCFFVKCQAAGGNATPRRNAKTEMILLFFTKYRAAGGNATPGRNAVTNFGPPEAMLHPDEMP